MRLHDLNINEQSRMARRIREFLANGEPAGPNDTARAMAMAELETSLFSVFLHDLATQYIVKHFDRTRQYLVGHTLVVKVRLIKLQSGASKKASFSNEAFFSSVLLVTYTPRPGVRLPISE